MPPIIDDRTPVLNLQLPNKDNLLEDDAPRVAAAITGIETALLARQLTSEKGAANGYAGLDSGGKVPAAQLPSFVDDVLEYANLAAFPGAGESGKIYVAQDTGKTYRWSGSAYTEISASPGSTDAVPEGATNKYFTDARARAAQQPATASTLGVVKAGTGLTVDPDGTIKIAGGAASVFTPVRLTPTAGQTVFTVPGGYVPGRMVVICNGATLYPDEDFTATNGTSLTLLDPAAVTDELLLLVFGTFTIADAATRAEIPDLAALPMQVISTNTTAVVGVHYIIIANLVLTLPPAPLMNKRVGFTNMSGLTTPQIDPNGKKIRGTTGVMNLNSPTASAVIQFTGDTYGWA